MHLTLEQVRIRNGRRKVLEVKNLHVNFHTYAGDVKAIRNVSFDLEKDKPWLLLVSLVLVSQ